MSKLAFIDIGELGWSLYLSAHLRWLRKTDNSKMLVMSYPDRKCLYDNLADEFMNFPRRFYKKYDTNKQDGPNLRRVPWEELKIYFKRFVPKGYRILSPGDYPRHINSDNRTFAPYGYSRPPNKKNEILVFPRCRDLIWAQRNLPGNFYENVINRLCDRFPKLTVRTMGTTNGAYDLKIEKPNYINWIGKSEGLQDLIDRCQEAVCAIGGTSAPPKITLLQGVPTFIVGHEKARFVVKENWMETKVDFFQVDKRAYQTFNDTTCVDAIVHFTKRCR